MVEAIQTAIDDYIDDFSSEAMDLYCVNDKFYEIRKYKELLDFNIITEEEFLQKKSELLDL